MLNIPWLEDARQRFEGRLARGQTPQALLIHGPAGIGRRHFALSVAARLLRSAWQPSPEVAAAELGGVPCADYFAVGPEEDSRVIKVDQIREMIHTLNLTSHAGGWKVGLIYPAETLHHSAANAFLKTLEEPPRDTTLILVSNAIGSLPPTVVSRCERIRLSPPTPAVALAWLLQRHPDRDACERALAFASGAPLTAKSLLGDGAESATGKVLAELGGELQKLIDRAIPPTTLARTWARRDAGVCLRWLYLQTAQLVRRQAPAPGAVNSLLAPLNIPGGPLNMAACCMHLEQIIEVQRLKDRSLNMEPLFAELLMWWYGAAGATRM